MAARSGLYAGYYQLPIAQAPETEKAIYQVCARVDSILSKCLWVQGISINGAYLDFANVRK